MLFPYKLLVLFYFCPICMAKHQRIIKWSYKYEFFYLLSILEKGILNFTSNYKLSNIFECFMHLLDHICLISKGKSSNV